MGGFGSGRKSGRDCTDDMRRLDVRTLSRVGQLTPGRCFGWQWERSGEVKASIDMHVRSDSVELSYRSRSHFRNGGDWEDMRYSVALDWTDCGFGGRRVWWRCPAVGCGRRVAVLFGGHVFACRQCQSLAYRSQREAEHERATRRADKIRARLNWKPGILHGLGEKPKGMHWQTFWRLQAGHEVEVMRSLAGFTTKARRLQERIDAFAHL